MSDVVIKQKASKQFIIVLSSVILIIMCISLISPDEHWGRFVEAVRLTGILGTVLWGLVFIFSFYRLIRPKDILIIGEKGFTDNSSLMSIGFVAWEYVDNIYIYSWLGVKILAIKLKEINNVNIPKAKKLLTIINVNKFFSKAEINILLTATDEKYEDVLSHMMLYYECQTNPERSCIYENNIFPNTGGTR